MMSDENKALMLRSLPTQDPATAAATTAAIKNPSLFHHLQYTCESECTKKGQHPGSNEGYAAVNSPSYIPWTHCLLVFRQTDIDCVPICIFGIL